MEKSEIRILKIGIAATYLAMVLVNALANLLPINNLTTGQVSDSYPNLFAPAGIAFSIWGLIYLLLAGHVIYQTGIFQKEKTPERREILAKIGRYFILTSVANACWVFAWHYKLVWLSVLLILAILYWLAKISGALAGRELSVAERLFVRLPFSVYFGWITVASIANVTVFLVSIGWDRFGIADDIWTVIILFAGAAIGIWQTLRLKSIAYCLVFVWAYSGIWVKHASAADFDSRYPNVITAVTACVVLFLLAAGYLFFGRVKKNSAIAAAQ